MSAHISLQIRHAFQDLERLAVGLEFPIARLWVAGTDRKSPRGDPLIGTYQESYLAMKINPPEGTIAEAIGMVHRAFLSAPADLLPVLADPDLRKSLYCTLDSEGERLDLNSLSILVELGIELEVE
ncbi:hypothetical protein M5C99_22055 [Acidovorax sp. NCPPB 2350]|nr:hypothetical protein M5C99_22055 [Acidovorax sp. NCPPB 2350]